MPRSDILKVLGVKEALETTFPRSSVMVDLRTGSPEIDVEALAEFDFAGILRAAGPESDTHLPVLHSLREARVVAQGDVIKIAPNGRLSVLYRRGANANSLFVTERCNSLCLMCSQPPRAENDDWRVEELLRLIPLIDTSLVSLGVTGGEPTLLGSDLKRILERACADLPNTHLHVLTNGRTFRDGAFVETFARVRDRTTWAVPLYADTAARHDFVVQASGAFDETIAGLYNLAERKHRIEIRFVLHAQTVPRLLQFCEFIWRSVPFAAHVALMGLEPMGFARQNRAQLWIDPADYAETLAQAAQFLGARGLSASIYNVPLCVLPKAAWSLARQSISDWKNVLAPECEDCDLKVDCCGFFRSADAEWRSRSVHPIKRATIQ